MKIFIDIDDTIRATTTAVLKKAKSQGDSITNPVIPVEFKSGKGYLFYYNTFPKDICFDSDMVKGTVKLFAFLKKIGLSPEIISVQPDPTCKDYTEKWLAKNGLVFPTHFVNKFKDKPELVKTMNLSYQAVLLDDYIDFDNTSALIQFRVNNYWSKYQLTKKFGHNLNFILFFRIWFHYFKQIKALTNRP